MPRVSVVMPVYRQVPEYFRAAVQSVLAQTWQDFEFVIVEDPSDQTAEHIVREFTDDRIKYHLNSSRTSLVAQRQQGLLLAQGELVAIFDSDDICEPERLAKQVEYLNEHPDVDVVGSQLIIIDGKGVPFAMRKYPTEHHEIAATLPIYCCLAQPSVMFRKDKVVAAGGYCYDKFFGTEDYELWCRLVESGATFANISLPLIRYRVQRRQLKANHLREQLKGTLDIKKVHWPRSPSWRSSIRRVAEHVLLVLPPAFVLWLFRQLSYQYRRH